MIESPQKKVGNRLKELRKSLLVNQREMADKLGITRAYWSALELGNKELTGNIIRLLIETFSISADWLLTGKKDSPVEMDPDLKSADESIYLDDLIIRRRNELETIYNEFVSLVELIEHHESKEEAKRDEFDTYLTRIAEIVFGNSSPLQRMQENLAITSVPISNKKSILKELDSKHALLIKEFFNQFKRLHRMVLYPNHPFKYKSSKGPIGD